MTREPAVLQRLPAGVEYTFVKQVFLEVPAELTTRSWMKIEGDKPPWSWFQTKSYRGIDRELQRIQRSAAQDAKSDAGSVFRALRAEFVKQVLGAVALEAGRTKRWIETRLLNPSGLLEQYRPPGLHGPLQFIGVWKHSQRGRRLVAHRIVPSGPPPWGDSTVAWFDPDQSDEIYRELFREFFSDVLRRRPGRHWRTNRPPVGWPLIVQFVVPKLYDYLRPYYPVRGYRHKLASASDGHYPLQLRRDICDLVHLELPHLARQLTPARVTAAIQRHVAVAPKDRPMGRAMFTVGDAAWGKSVT